MRNPIDCEAKLRLREKYRNMNQSNDYKGHTLFSRRRFVQGIASAGALAAFGGKNGLALWRNRSAERLGIVGLALRN